MDLQLQEPPHEQAYSEEELLSRLARAEQLLAQAHKGLSATQLSRTIGCTAGDELPGVGAEKALARQRLGEGLRTLREYVPVVQKERRRIGHNLIEIRVSLACLYDDVPKSCLSETEEIAQRELDRVSDLYRRLLQLIERIQQLLHKVTGKPLDIPSFDPGAESDDVPLRTPEVPDLSALVQIPPQETVCNPRPGVLLPSTPVSPPPLPGVRLAGLASPGPLTGAGDHGGAGKNL